MVSQRRRFSLLKTLHIHEVYPQGFWFVSGAVASYQEVCILPLALFVICLFDLRIMPFGALGAFTCAHTTVRGRTLDDVYLQTLLCVIPPAQDQHSRHASPGPRRHATGRRVLASEYAQRLTLPPFPCHAWQLMRSGSCRLTVLSGSNRPTAPRQGDGSVCLSPMAAAAGRNPMCWLHSFGAPPVYHGLLEARLPETVVRSGIFMHVCPTMTMDDIRHIILQRAAVAQLSAEHVTHVEQDLMSSCRNLALRLFYNRRSHPGRALPRRRPRTTRPAAPVWDCPCGLSNARRSPT